MNEGQGQLSLGVAVSPDRLLVVAAVAHPRDSQSDYGKNAVESMEIHLVHTLEYRNASCRRIDGRLDTVYMRNCACWLLRFEDVLELQAARLCRVATL